MIIGRIIGYLFIALALLVLGSDLVRALAEGGYRAEALGALWFRLDVTSLNLVQAVIQRYIWPALWDPGIATVLQWPAWLVFAGLGIVLLALSFRRRRP